LNHVKRRLLTYQTNCQLLKVMPQLLEVPSNVFVTFRPSTKKTERLTCTKSTSKLKISARHRVGL
jgi:hypothetical protein